MKLPKEVAIYGAGFLGKWMFYHLKFLGYKVKFFIDEHKEEKIFLGCKVYKIDSVSDKKIPICVCVNKGVKSIKEKLVKLGFYSVYTFEELAGFIKEDFKNLNKFEIPEIECEEVILDHALGGGSNLYTEEYTKHKKNTVIIRIFPINFLEIPLFLCIYDTKEENFFPGFDRFCEFLKLSAPKVLTVNHLITYPLPGIIKFLKNLKKQRNFFLVFNVHDYFSICPSYNLLNNASEFCNIPENLDMCKNCFKQNFFIKEILNFLPKTSISKWRKVFKEFFELVDEVRCFSYASKDILLRVYPFLKNKIVVKPHQVNWVRPVKAIQNSEKLNVGIIGNINIAKGAEVVLNLHNYLESNKTKGVKLHIFGRLITDEPLKEDEWLKIYGPYKKEELPNIIKNHEINVIFIPSIWPETFCYTAEEGMKMGLPVAVFDLGAPAERVKNYEKGIVLDYSKRFDSKYVIKMLEKCKNLWIS